MPDDERIPSLDDVLRANFRQMRGTVEFLAAIGQRFRMSPAAVVTAFQDQQRHGAAEAERRRFARTSAASEITKRPRGRPSRNGWR